MQRYLHGRLVADLSRKIVVLTGARQVGKTTLARALMSEVDFCISLDQQVAQLVECKLADAKPHRALVRFAAQFPAAEAVQLVRDLRQVERRRGVDIARAGDWLVRLAA